MSLNIYTVEDVEIIRLSRLGMTNNGITYRLEIADVKSRLATIFKLAGVKNKKELNLKFKGVDLKTLLPS